MIANRATTAPDSNRIARFKLLARRLLVAAAVVCICLFTGPSALAAKKKPKEAAPEEKSYVFPYIIVGAIVGIGLMTVCRPSNRLDRAAEKAKKEKEEE